MSLETIKKEEMESMRVLAETNMKISEAKAALSGIETSKDEFMAAREKEALEVVASTLEKIAEMLKDIGTNYEKLKEIRGLVLNIVDFADTFSKQIVSMKEELSESSEKATEKIRSWRLELEKREEEIKASLLSIESEKSALSEAWEKLRKAQKRLESDQKALAVAYKEIQNKKI
ncbi:MAG: hypothetical protein WC767_01055 [Candidatus Paceibacterota bacterium]|jgi:DNA repair exonuclease SbcCD ATPase subunit